MEREINETTSGRYDRAQYEEALLPKTKLEEELWRGIEQADAAIRNILKRINKISIGKFGEDFFTIESCSGHVNQDGSLAKNEVLFRDHGITQEYHPLLIFRVNKWRRVEEMISYFRAIYLKAIENTNQKFGKEVLKYGSYHPNHKQWENEYLSKENKYMCYDFTLKDKLIALQVLESFWEEIEAELEKIDNLPFRTEFKENSFVRNNPNQI